MFLRKYKIIIFFFIFFLFLSFKIGVFAIGEKENFYVDPYYDIIKRTEVQGFLQIETENLYIFIEEEWLNNFNYLIIDRIKKSANKIADDFENKIYSQLTSVFGREPNQFNKKITVFFHQMNGSAGGYFNPKDQYSVYQYPYSNERNILYLNTSYLESNLISAYLAHEFIHLITFNQKDSKYLISEEVWLNELRAEYAITFLGYDNLYKKSNLERRVGGFLLNPNVSLVEWTNSKADYGAINLFAQYLVDYYGINILIDSLQSDKIGIESINYALKKRGYKENFSDIFINWIITLYINDCSLGEKYCYKNENLKNIKIIPQIDYLSKSDNIEKSINNFIKNWSGNWQKIIGGESNIVLEFKGDKDIDYKVVYILCDLEENCFVNFLKIDSNNEKVKLEIKNFENYTISIIPFVQDKTSGFNGVEKSFNFFTNITANNVKSEEDILRKNILVQIAGLQEEIRRLQLLISDGKKDTCMIRNNLYFGIINSEEVRCLQEFFKKDASIYPEGLVTGNFLNLTQKAVIKFQEKYTSEILIPLGLQKGTGYVGRMTRVKINQILGF